MTPSNREAWLTRATEALIRLFDAPPRGPWRVTCGWPSRRGTAAKSRVIGECWSPRASGDGTIEIIISIALADAVEVLGVLAHELAHAHLPEGTGHRSPFARLVKKMGLEGKPTATVVGDTFRANVARVLDELGPYPHASLDYTTRKKQGIRMLKAQCAFCGYTVRLTRKWIEVALPRCPVHELEMKIDV